MPSLLSLLLFLLSLIAHTNAFSNRNSISKALLRRRSDISSTSLSSTSSSQQLTVSQWHSHRRQQMLEKYGDEIRPLLKKSKLTLPLLAIANGGLLSLSVLCRYLSWMSVVGMAASVGSILSLWQLQLLHEVLHANRHSKLMLFVGSFPNVFGYYLYLQRGHLSHHKNVGTVNVNQVFTAGDDTLPDGDVLFVSHRMQVPGAMGPRVRLHNKERLLSISNMGLQTWRKGQPYWNMMMFACSFLYERVLLVFNEVVVALSGRNYFFPNQKQSSFHRDCAQYARWGLLLRGLLYTVAGWKALVFLFLSETLWSIPPHPASAMFVTNHPSSMSNNNDTCQPTRSTYAGRWYSILTLGTNYHTEHHDFPTMPLESLGRLRQIAPEYYANNNKSSFWSIWKQAFGRPDNVYACMNSNIRI